MLPANATFRLVSGEPPASPAAEEDSGAELAAPAKTTSTPSEVMFATTAMALLDSLPT